MAAACRAGWIIAAAWACAIAAGATGARAADDAIEAVLPRVVKIFGAGGYRNLYAYGTGFLVSAEGHIATVSSPVLDTEKLTVVLHDGRQFEAKLLGAEPPLDLAVLKLEGENLSLPYFDLSEAGAAGPGTRVLGFSNMFKVATGDEPVSVIHGIIAAHTKLSGRRGSFEMSFDGPLYVVDAVTNNPGAGGGVLTTQQGQLVGMIGKQVRNAESNTWVNYAIPVTELRVAIEEIVSGQFRSSADQANKIAEELRRYTPLDFGLVLVPDVVFRTPAYIDTVVADSPAARAGLKRDDLVLFANDELVQSRRMFETVLGKLEAGDTLRLVVRRGGALVPVEMPVMKKADSQER